MILDNLKIRLNITDDTTDSYIQGLITLIKNKLVLKYGWDDRFNEDYNYIVETYIYCLLRVKKILGLEYTDTTSDDQLLLNLDDSTQEILNYCNLKYFPVGLENELIQLMKVFYDNPDVNKIDNNISAVKEGDVSVSYQTPNGKSQNINTFMNDFQLKLNKFREFKY